MALQLQIYTQKTINGLPETVRSLLAKLDIYYQPEFLECDARMQGGSYEIAVCTEDEAYWIYPYIVLPIAGTDDFDLSSPYGYAGPVCSLPTFGITAEMHFEAYCKQRGNIVTEFVRYHWQYNTEFRFEVDMSNHLNRQVVILPLDKEIDIWTEQFSGTNRNLVRKLEKEDYSWSIKTFASEDIPDFDAAYRANMVHTNATDFYFFSADFYQQLIDQLGEKLLLAKVEKDGIVYASALFFVSGGIVTYYLSARNLDFPKVPGSNLLLSNTALWAQEHGMSALNFGGGLSMNEDDFLFKFKRNFGKTIAPFYIGKRIHQPEKYDALKTRYVAEHGQEKFESVKHILQFYR